MEIMRENWGKTKKNEQVLLYKLKNNHIEVEILNYGGIIRKILMKDRYGNMENIVLSMESIEEYEEYSPYFGAIVGRNAGRIAEARFEIDGGLYELSKNSGNNNIHGGISNFSHKVWSSKSWQDGERGIVELTLVSPDGEEGFPGNLQVKVRYILQGNELVIKYFAKTDKKTFLNMTNHSYFNLSGDRKRDVLEHHLRVNADKFIEVQEETLPVRISPVEGGAFDFRDGKELKKSLNSKEEQIEIVGGGLDHPFVLKDRAGVVLADRESGRKLEVSTTENSVVIYSGNYLQDVKTLKTPKFKKYDGIAFETQNYPDVINFLKEKANLIDVDKPYSQETKYKFILENREEFI